VRRANAWLVLSLCVVLATACGLWQRAKHAVVPQPDPPEAIRWNGVLFVPTDSLADTTLTPYGTAWMAPVASTNQLIRVRVDLVRAPPTVRYDWRIHIGTCLHDRGVFGPPAVYPILVVDSTGHAVGNTMLQLGFPNRGAYFVRVEAVDSGVPARFCGTLTPPG
jgi:hypothetical protein